MAAGGVKLDSLMRLMVELVIDNESSRRTEEVEGGGSNNRKLEELTIFKRESVKVNERLPK